MRRGNLGRCLWGSGGGRGQAPNSRSQPLGGRRLWRTESGARHPITGHRLPRQVLQPAMMAEAMAAGRRRGGGVRSHSWSTGPGNHIQYPHACAAFPRAGIIATARPDADHMPRDGRFMRVDGQSTLTQAVAFVSRRRRAAQARAGSFASASAQHVHVHGVARGVHVLCGLKQPAFAFQVGRVPGFPPCRRWRPATESSSLRPGTTARAGRRPRQRRRRVCGPGRQEYGGAARVQQLAVYVERASYGK